MADVAALVKVKDQPELIEEILALPAWNRHDIAMVVERRIAQRRQEEAYVEAVAEQKAKGHPRDRVRRCRRGRRPLGDERGVRATASPSL